MNKLKTLYKILYDNIRYQNTYNGTYLFKKTIIKNPQNKYYVHMISLQKKINAYLC